MAKDHGLEQQEYYGSHHCYVNFSHQTSQWSSIQQTPLFFKIHFVPDIVLHAAELNEACCMGIRSFPSF